MDGSREFDLLAGQIAVRIFGELLAQDQNAVERPAQLVRHVGQEFGLVFRGLRELGCLLFERAAGLLDLLVLALDFDVAFGELLGLLLELFVGLLQFLLLGLQFGGELLGLFQQAFGLHRGLNRIEHDTDRVGELFQESHLRGRECAHRGEFDDGLDLVLEQHRQHHEVLWNHAEQRRIDRHRIRRNVRDQPLTLVHRALPDQALAELHDLLMRIDPVAGVSGKQVQLRIVFVGDLVDHAHMRVHQRRQFGQEQPADRRQVALALQHVGEAGEVGLEPVLLGIDVGGEPKVANHRIDVVLELRHFAARVDLDRAGEVALGHRGRDFGNGANLRGQVRRQQIDVAGEVLPGAGGTGHVGLAAEPSLDADFAGDARDMIGERRQGLGHVVDGVGKRCDFALRFHREVLLQIAVGDRGHDLDDATDLFGKIGRHEVDGVGQVLPGAGDARHLRLTAELAFGADLARNARDFAGKGVELVDHRVDGVLQLEDFALHVDRDLARQVAAGDRGRDFGDVAHLGGEVRRQQVDVVGEVLPGAADAGHHGLAAQAPFGADFARDTRHFGGKGAQLLDHGVQRVLQEQDLAAHVDRDLFRQVAAGDRGRDLGDVAHLGCQVRRHEVDVVGEVLPGAGDFGHFGLTAELAFGADFAGDAGHFGGERVELVDHGVDGVLQLEDFALHVDGDLARQVAAGHRGRDFRDVADLRSQISRHRVDAVGQVLPGPGDAGHVGLSAEPAFGADLARDARDFAGKAIELVDHRIERFFQLKDLAADVDGDLARQVAAGDRGRDFRDVADLRGQIAGHRVDAVGQILPGAGDAGHFGLSPELAVGADFARHARHLAGKGVELVDPRIQRFLYLQDCARDVHGDLLRQVALGDRGRDFRDVADLAGEVGGHRVDAVGQVLPGAGNAAHHRLSPELSFGADLARYARHLAGKGVELVDHGVDGVLQLQDFAAHVHRDLLRQVAIGDGGRHFRDVADLRGQVRRHRVDAFGEVLPGAGDAEHVGLAAEPSVGAYLARDARDFAGKRLKRVDQGVEGFLHLKDLARHVHRDLLGQVAAGNGSGDVGDVADLGGQIARHEVDVVGEVLPGAGDAWHLGLAAELAFGADFARDPRHFRGKGVELVDHRVDGVFQFEDFASHVHRDLAREVAAGHRRGDVGDIADLRCQIAAHRVHGVG